MDRLSQSEWHELGAVNVFGEQRRVGARPKPKKPPFLAHQSNFAAAKFRMGHSNSRALVFSSGKVVCTGAASVGVESRRVFF